MCDSNFALARSTWTLYYIYLDEPGGSLIDLTDLIVFPYTNWDK